MANREVVIRRMALLEEYLRDLEEVKKRTTLAEFVADKVIQRYVERTLHMAIGACLDMGNHIISFEGLREPSSNQEVFGVLEEWGLFSKELRQNLEKMAQFRNLLVHDYARIKAEIIFRLIHERLDDLREFAVIISNIFF